MTKDTSGHVAVQLAWHSCLACDSTRYVSLLVKGIGERMLTISHCFSKILGRDAILGIHAPVLMKPFGGLRDRRIQSIGKAHLPAGVDQRIFDGIIK